MHWLSSYLTWERCLSVWHINRLTTERSFLSSQQSTVRMLSLRGCTLWTPPCSVWPSPARWGCPCPALRAAPPMPSCAGTWPPETTFTTCPISAMCMPTAPSSSTPSHPPPITALSMTTSTSALLRTRQARFGAPAFTSKQVRVDTPVSVNIFHTNSAFFCLHAFRRCWTLFL